MDLSCLANMFVLRDIVNFVLGSVVVSNAVLILCRNSFNFLDLARFLTTLRCTLS